LFAVDVTMLMGASADVNMSVLQRNVALVAEVLAKHSFGFNGRKFNVFEVSKTLCSS
jgi:hypothetical protein